MHYVVCFSSLAIIFSVVKRENSGDLLFRFRLRIVLDRKKLTPKPQFDWTASEKSDLRTNARHKTALCQAKDLTGWEANGEYKTMSSAGRLFQFIRHLHSCN